MTLQTTPRPRKCAVKSCRLEFTPKRTFIRWCSPECGTVLGLQKKEKAAALEAKRARQAHQQAKERVKCASTLKAEAQTAFNAWIRFRDRDQLCICCGSSFEPEKPGGSVDAGHYLSVGSAPQLRFDERNVHAQRKNCNRPGGTTRAKFRAGMIARIGLEAVEALEADQSERRYRADDYRAIRDLYRAKLKDAKAAARHTAIEGGAG